MLYGNERKGQDKPYVFKVGNGKTNEIDKNGAPIRIRGYASRAGNTLYNLLNRNPEVKVVAIGETAVSNMVKAVAHANFSAMQDDKVIVGSNFRFENVKVENNGSTSKIKALSILLTLVDVDDEDE